MYHMEDTSKQYNNVSMNLFTNKRKPLITSFMHTCKHDIFQYTLYVTMCTRIK